MSNDTNIFTDSPYPRSIRVLRWCIWIGAAAFLAWLAIQYTGIFGVATFRGHFQPQESIIRAADPTRLERVESDSGAVLHQVRDNQFQFIVEPTVAYEELQLRIRFQSQGRPNVLLVPQVRAGRDEAVIPLQADALDQLSWNMLSESGVRLWQKNNRFTTIEDFFAASDRGRVALVWYDPHVSEVRSDQANKAVLPSVSGDVLEPTHAAQLQEYDVVLSTYQPSIPDGAWNVGQISLRLPELHVNANQFYFTLRTPESDQANDRLLLDWVQTRFTKDPLNPAEILQKLF